MARLGCLLLSASLVLACGKKGPPLAPLHLVPNVVKDVEVRRTGDDVRIRFKLPETNLNGPGPVELDRVEIYAITVAAGAPPPPNRDLMSASRLIGTVQVKPAPVKGEPVAANAPPDPRPAPGEAVSFVESLTADKLKPVPQPKPREVPAAPATAAPAVAAAPALPVYPARIYVIRGMTKRGRPGQPSPRVPVPIVVPPPQPTELTASFTATAVTLSWMPPASAAADAPPVRFNVYKADGTTPLNAEPLAAATFEHAGTEFGTAQCFAVRSVETVESIPIESGASATACVTPKDIFPPAAPQRLQAVATPGLMNLSWQANAEPDLAGYVVLRGEAPGGTLQALTPEPITATRFADKTARPGVRYVYAVVAVDRATPSNTSAQSNRIEETAR